MCGSISRFSFSLCFSPSHTHYYFSEPFKRMPFISCAFILKYFSVSFLRIRIFSVSQYNDPNKEISHWYNPQSICICANCPDNVDYGYFFSQPRIQLGSQVACNFDATLVSFNLDLLLSLSFSFMTSTFLKCTDQLFWRTSLSWCLSAESL